MSLHPVDAAGGQWRLGELLRENCNCQHSSSLMIEENQHGDWKQVANKGPKSKGKNATVPFKRSGKAKSKKGPRHNRSKSNSGAASDASSLRREQAEATRTRASQLQAKALKGFRTFLIEEKNRMQKSSSITSPDFVAAPPESMSLAQEATDAFAYLQERKNTEQEHQEAAKTQEEMWRRLSQRIQRRKEWDLVDEAR